MVTYEERVQVRLTEAEALWAASVGMTRHIDAVMRGLPAFSDRQPAEQQRSPWHVHVEGALAELAVAKYMGTRWPANVHSYRDVDVPPDIEVRQTDLAHGCLLLRPKDIPLNRAVLVTGTYPQHALMGWCFIHEGMREEHKRGNVWWVPQRELHGMLTWTH